MGPILRRCPKGGQAGRRGSAIVEFALIIPLFFTIVFGLIKFAMIFAGYCGAAYASQVAVRYASVHGVNSSSGESSTVAAINTLVVPYLWAAQSGGTVVTVAWNPDNSVGSSVSVKISLTYTTGIPWSKLNSVKVGSAATGTIVF